MPKLTVAQWNAIYNAICEASNETARRGLRMGTAEIAGIMRRHGLDSDPTSR